MLPSTAAGAQAGPLIRPTRGRSAAVQDDDPTLGALRHAERTAYLELSRAYADLADIEPGDTDAMWNARRRVSRHTGFWTEASDAYFAALAASTQQGGAL